MQARLRDGVSGVAILTLSGVELEMLSSNTKVAQVSMCSGETKSYLH